MDFEDLVADDEEEEYLAFPSGDTSENNGGDDEDQDEDEDGDDGNESEADNDNSGRDKEKSKNKNDDETDDDDEKSEINFKSVAKENKMAKGTVIEHYPILLGGIERLKNLYINHKSQWSALPNTVKVHRMRRCIDRRFDGPKHLRTRDFSDDDNFGFFW